MNVVRVIFLDQNVVVDVCEGMRPSKQHGREPQRELRSEIERCVDSGIAIFPYSEVHLTEAANVSDPESRSEQIQFWEKVSRQYRFHDAKAIESIQLQTILKHRPVRFSRELAIHKSQLTFEQELPPPDPDAKAKRAKSFRGLVEYWASKASEDLTEKIRHKEVEGMIRLIFEDLSNFLKTGDLPLNRIFSKHNELHSELCWRLREHGSNTNTVFEDACCWLKDNALKIPSLLIDFVGTEYLAEQFATDAKFRKKVENAEADHDANDLEAAAHWFPYADFVFADTKVVTFLFPKLRSAVTKAGSFEISAERPILFSSRAKFLNFLRELKPTEIVSTAEGEMQDDRGSVKMLLYILRTPESLISRETIERRRDLSAEILPGGGLRIDARGNETSWDMIASFFQEIRGYINEDGKAATVTTAEWKDRQAHASSALLTLGTLSLQIGDIRGALHCNLAVKA
jgi:hypothetical protein